MKHIPLKGVLSLTCLAVASSLAAYAQAPSFVDETYPVLEQARCSQCHQDNGVASATRLKFPHKEASDAAISQFGLSLVRLVDRENPKESLLLRKPTNQTPHGGGERFPVGSPQEKVLLAWINRLAALTGPEAAEAIEAWDNPEEVSGRLESAVLRRLTNKQYDNTVRDLLKDFSKPALRFPPDDYVEGYQNQYEALSVSLGATNLADVVATAGGPPYPPQVRRRRAAEHAALLDQQASQQARNA